MQNALDVTRCNLDATKMYGELVREDVPTRAKLQPRNDSRIKEKCMLGEMHLTWFAWTYFVSCIWFTEEDDYGIRYLPEHE